jgi:hypothetical protein
MSTKHRSEASLWRSSPVEFGRSYQARASGEIGRRAGFRFQCPNGCAGSSPASRTRTIVEPIDTTPSRSPVAGRHGQHPAAGAVSGIARVPFPHRPPRPEHLRQISPRHTGAQPIQHPSTVLRFSEKLRPTRPSDFGNSSSQCLSVSTRYRSPATVTTARGQLPDRSESLRG